MKVKYEYLSRIDLESVKDRLPCRYKDSHKGTFGTMMCISGSRGMVGACMFPILSALRSGVGIVRAMMIKSLYDVVCKDILEPIYTPLEENFEGTISKTEIPKIIENLSKCSSVLVGCGIGWNNDTKEIVAEILKNSTVPIIVDADGINVISDDVDMLKSAKSDVVLTPHIKEFSRLTDRSIDEIKVNKIQIAKEFTDKYGVTLVLKGSNTHIIDKEGNVYMNTTGNSGMAKGGSGDVLAGMIGSFLAQKMSPIDASICAVYIHGWSGDRCSEKKSKTSMLPTDIIDELSNIFLEIEK